VTIALASIRKIKVGDAAAYVIVQFIGAWLAILAVSALTGGSLSLSVDHSVLAGVAEAVGAFVFLLGIASVVSGKTPSALSGVVIGTSLLLGIMAARGGGILNPAVAFALGSLAAPQALGSVVGALLGVWVYRGIVGKQA
jgi:glycerol uptake facilitator-like aquaporin